MADHSNIAWTNATWNPVRGCERVSEGCRNCYAEELAARHSYEGGWGSEVAEWVKRPGGKLEARWTGVIQTIARQLEVPLRWREPRRVFVNSMSDLFHDRVPMDFLDKCFAVMAMSSRHTFQILTKRPQRMLDYLTREDIAERIGHAEFEIAGSGLRTAIKVDSYAGPQHRRASWPLPNVWFGVSAEDQATFDERVPLLLRTPAKVRFVSLEPLLGHIDLIGKDEQGSALHTYEDRPRLNWGIVGGESGQAFRAMPIEAARYIVAQFHDAGVPLFVKQDNGPRPGMRGRFTEEEFSLKEYPS